jgi:hypothetical protein
MRADGAAWPFAATVQNRRHIGIDSRCSREMDAGQEPAKSRPRAGQEPAKTVPVISPITKTLIPEISPRDGARMPRDRL